VTNFVMLAKAGYYDGLTFHRVVPGFVIQGGDPQGNGSGGESVYGAMFEDEINAETYGLEKKLLKDEVKDDSLPANLKNATIKEYLELQGYRFNSALPSLPMDRGMIAMANRGPNTNGSQFFITVRDGGVPWLEGKHTVFGKVTQGMDIADAVAATPKDAQNQPLEPVTFTVEVTE
jgi:peptidyl-prolyl cis-trans isomerase B (cyclophilin B)